MNFLSFTGVLLLLVSTGSFSEAEPNKELLCKWKQVAKFFDKDDSGDVGIDDFWRIADHLQSSGTLSGTKWHEVQTLARTMWVTFLGNYDKSSLTHAEFVANLARLMDRQEVGAVAIQFRGRMFDLIDGDDNGILTQTEFLKFSEALGRGDDHGNQVHDFDLIDKATPGQLTRAEYLGAYVRYFTDPKLKCGALPLFGVPEDVPGKADKNPKRTLNHKD